MLNYKIIIKKLKIIYKYIIIFKNLKIKINKLNIYNKYL